MARKLTLPMIATATQNEQQVTTPIVATATGNSREYGEFARFNRAVFLLDVSAVSGTTPTLDVVIEGFNESSARWHVETTFTQVTAVTRDITKTCDPLYYTLYRARWTIAGTTPSFTFTLQAIMTADG